MPMVFVILAVFCHVPFTTVSLHWLYPPEGYILLVGNVDLLPRLIKLGMNGVKGSVYIIPFFLLVPISLGIIIFSL